MMDIWMNISSNLNLNKVYNILSAKKFWFDTETLNFRPKE